MLYFYASWVLSKLSNSVSETDSRLRIMKPVEHGVVSGKDDSKVLENRSIGAVEEVGFHGQRNGWSPRRISSKKVQNKHTYIVSKRIEIQNQAAIKVLIYN